VELHAPEDDWEEFWVEETAAALGAGQYSICVDGLLGMQFRAPLESLYRELLRWINQECSIGFRVAVDLPSGLGASRDADAFLADVTYGTGIFKEPLLMGSCGHARYLDIGFFKEPRPGKRRVIKDEVLSELKTLRPASGEKRSYGHLLVIAGSRSMPGALAMSVRAALKSGVGLVTACAPESVAAQLACQLPEAIWRTWPESPEGGLALEGLWQARQLEGKATALLLGPGMGAEAETQALMQELARFWTKPAVLDADALRAPVIDAFGAEGERVLTPHDGELRRFAGEGALEDEALMRAAGSRRACIVRKGAMSRIASGEILLVNSTGNGVLSRGGSGDLLAGLLGGLLAQGRSGVHAAAQAVYWHGKASDLLARDRGQTAVSATELLEFLPEALR